MIHCDFTYCHRRKWLDTASCSDLTHWIRNNASSGKEQTRSCQIGLAITGRLNASNEFNTKWFVLVTGYHSVKCTVCVRELNIQCGNVCDGTEQGSYRFISEAYAKPSPRKLIRASRWENLSESTTTLDIKFLRSPINSSPKSWYIEHLSRDFRLQAVNSIFDGLRNPWHIGKTDSHNHVFLRPFRQVVLYGQSMAN